MAAPVIRSATLDRTTLAPGQSATLTIDAYDPDTRPVTLRGTATDLGGTSSAEISINLQVSDPVTLVVTCDDPGVIVAPGAGVGVFTVTVAA